MHIFMQPRSKNGGRAVAPDSLSPLCCPANSQDISVNLQGDTSHPESLSKLIHPKKRGIEKAFTYLLVEIQAVHILPKNIFCRQFGVARYLIMEST
jgi:hypothetical protein